ncbi:MAG: SAM-dependent methyltransferase [Tannerellaceae bacterium]|jgi:predicted O-methyltransferase YrrM|nr:SAM-dependent methyltransferase [Tannerellaceae bacterium]
MRNILAHRPFIPGLISYRRLLHRKGFGIHSPFVFDLATKVIGERYPFYCFGEIEGLRRKFLSDDTRLASTAKQRRARTVARLVANEGIRPRKGELLFRLVNFLKPQTVLQVGSTVGFSTLYLSSYSPDVKCVSIEKPSEYAAVSQRVYAGARNAVEHHVGDYEQILPAVLKTLGRVDFVYFNLWREPNPSELFDICMEYRTRQSAFVFEGICRNRRMHKLWKQIRENQHVTATIDLLSIGIAFVDPNLFKHNYRTCF